MKETFTRFLFYLFIAIVISGPFRSSWPDAASADPLAIKFAFYFIHYGIGWLFWAFLFLSIHEAVRWARRRNEAENAPTAALDVPETRPLDKP